MRKHFGSLVLASDGLLGINIVLHKSAVLRAVPQGLVKRRVSMRENTAKNVEEVWRLS